jgi:hypothetical protein
MNILIYMVIYCKKDVNGSVPIPHIRNGLKCALERKCAASPHEEGC